MSMNVYLSVGRTYTPAQKQFVDEFEQHLRARGLTPQTVGRNYFKNREPLRTISDCMRECQGAVILAFERIHIESGVEMRGGSDPGLMSGVNLPTVWNQIEAAMAYALGRPLLVVVEPGLRSEGLLEPKYDWYVVPAPLNQSLFSDPVFTGVLEDFKDLLTRPRPAPEVDLGSLGVGQLIARLKPAQLWATLVAVAGMVAAAAALAYQLGAMNGGPS